MNVDLFGIPVASPKSKLIRPSPCSAALASLAPASRSEPVFAEVTKILPHYSVIYAREITGFFSNRQSDMPKHNQPAAGVSDKAARRLGSALNWMVLFSPHKKIWSNKEKFFIKFKINFITLTLPSPQVHDDHFIKQRLLAPFLKWLVRSWNVNSYVWKAEAQENGNIHFHITTNMFVHWKSIRTKWNKLLARYGYCKVFQDGTNDKGDAATSVKSVKTMKGIVSYLQGYITKKDLFKKKLSRTCLIDDGIYTKKSYRVITCLSDGAQLTKEYKRPIEGKLWSTSQNLAKINCVLDMESDPDYYEVRNDLMKNSKVIFADKFIRIMTHRELKKSTNHPTISGKLRDIYNKHFKAESLQTEFQIESFY